MFSIRGGGEGEGGCGEGEGGNWVIEAKGRRGNGGGEGKEESAEGEVNKCGKREGGKEGVRKKAGEER